MDNVVKLKRHRNETIRGAAHKITTDAMRSVDDPTAIVVVALGMDGTFAARTASERRIHDFDKYSRAICALERMRDELMESRD